MPIRIHRQRIKGWKNPQNTKYVGRGTMYGNGWKIGDGISRKQSLFLFENSLMLMGDRLNDFLKPLIGKNLSCFCPLHHSCHVDIYLRLIKERFPDEQN